jgi:hypothetical protein
MDQRADDHQPTIEETGHDREETRASMSDKLALLEERVRDTVEETKTAMGDIVENVKGTVNETLGTVRETIDGTQSTVEHIVENVKGTMDETVTRVKQAFDIRSQVDQHPWLLLGASVVTGSFLASFLHRGRQERSSSFHTAQRHDGLHVTDTTSSTGIDTVPSDENGPKSRGRSAPTQTQKGQSWGGALELVYEEFGNVMKGTVIGTLREMIRQTLPSFIAPFDKMVTNVSKKLGTEPLESTATREQTQGKGHTPPTTESVI